MSSRGALRGLTSGAPPARPSDRMPDFAAAAAAASRTVADWPADRPIRLNKKTSNLFRYRRDAEAALDLSAFDGVYWVDPDIRRAMVGGLTTYENLVARTLPHGVSPMCVPQLRTITLGGAVTGLGIESPSFRNGCPHETVVAMDVLTGTGEVVRAEPGGEHADLFYGFPNSYGSLGYALRLEIEVEPVADYVALTHVPCASYAEATAVLTQVARERTWDGQQVDFIDGTVFGPDETYVTLGRYTDDPGPASDYTGMQIYYRSLQQRSSDRLTTHDYLWRWDTDWFWCSRAMGAQNVLIRRFWPKSLLRSDVYWKLVALDRRLQFSARLDSRRGLPPRESVVQDVEIPIEALPEFLEFFDREVGISPVWLCPLQQRDPDAYWSLYSFDPSKLYVNVGFWSTVPRTDGGDPEDGAINRAIEAQVTRLGGRKSLYSTSFYDRDEFYRIYGGDDYWKLKQRYDPDSRFAELYDKCVTPV